MALKKRDTIFSGDTAFLATLCKVFFAVPHFYLSRNMSIFLVGQVVFNNLRGYWFMFAYLKYWNGIKMIILKPFRLPNSSFLEPPNWFVPFFVQILTNVFQCFVTLRFGTSAMHWMYHFTFLMGIWSKYGYQILPTFSIKCYVLSHGCNMLNKLCHSELAI